MGCRNDGGQSYTFRFTKDVSNINKNVETMLNSDQSKNHNVYFIDFLSNRVLVGMFQTAS